MQTLSKPLHDQIQNYVSQLTKTKYQSFPEDVFDSVKLNLTRVAKEILDSIKTHPDKNLLCCRLGKILCDKAGYTLICTAVNQLYSITIQSAELSLMGCDEQKQTNHVLLKNISISLSYALTYSTFATFKADNPHVFPKSNKLMITTPYSLKDHNLVEWEKAKQGVDTTVTFSVGGKTFHAHKTKLVMHSTYFKCMYETNMLETKENALINLNEISAEHFETVLQFIYMGYLDERYKTLEQLFDMVLVANHFGVVKLGELCVEKIHHILLQNSIDAAGLSNIFGVIEQIDQNSLLLDVCLMQVEASPELKSCLISALNKRNLCRFTEIAKQRNLTSVLEIIDNCKTYNPSLN